MSSVSRRIRIMTHAPPPHDHAELEARIEAALAEADNMLRRREYFEAHEVLEHVWMHTRGLERNFLGGVILCASALHKERHQHNSPAARRILSRAIFRLAHVPNIYRGINVRRLESSTHAALLDHSIETLLPRD